MHDAYIPTNDQLARYPDRDVSAGEDLANYLQARFFANTLDVTSSTAFAHPDTGSAITLVHIQVDLPMAERFPMLLGCDLVELVMTEYRTRAFPLRGTPV
jgi:hypothetical protein